MVRDLKIHLQHREVELSFLGKVFTSLHVHDLMVDCGEASTISINVAT